MFCNKCIIPMKHVLRFMDGKNYELYRCPNCSHETKAIPFSFHKEISQKTIGNTKPNRRKGAKNVRRIYNHNTRNT